jgi:hypothetical protein
MADFLMARFDVYANPGARAAATPFLLDVQSDCHRQSNNPHLR